MHKTLPPQKKDTIFSASHVKKITENTKSENLKSEAYLFKCYCISAIEGSAEKSNFTVSVSLPFQKELCLMYTPPHILEVLSEFVESGYCVSELYTTVHSVQDESPFKIITSWRISWDNPTK